MSTVNIRRDVKDAFYRYKMPKIQSKIEGKGNGIKTVVSNMTDVAKALGRPPAYVTKFFGNELGSIVHCDDKTGRYIVNGAHDADKLASLLDSFIAKFVLCPACDNPETELSISSGREQTIYRTCKACGHRATVDMGHKLVTFIQKNPPPKPRKLVAKKPSDDGTEPRDPSDPQEEARQDEEQVGMMAPDNLDDFGQMTARDTARFDNDDWADSRDTREAELAGLSAAVRDMTVSGKDAHRREAEAAALDAFGDFLAAAVADTAVSNADIIARIEELDLPMDKAVAVAVQVLLDDDPKQQQPLSAAFARRIPLFRELVGTGKEQKAFLGGLERLVGLHRPDGLRFLPGLLQAAYNEDIIDDEAILDWHAHVSRRYMTDKAAARRVRDAAGPFIAWLKASESESESESE